MKTQLTDFQAFEALNNAGDPRLLIVCDHASNATPEGYGSLGLDPADFERHIAYDIGVAGVTRALSEILDCPAVLSRFSRLVIDPNRGEDDPTLIMKVSDGSIIPDNRRVGEYETAKRLELCHRPYHRAIEQVIERAERDCGQGPAIISIHSFTRQLNGRLERPWHIGILSDWDRKTADALLDRFRAEKDLCVGDNEPYTGKLMGDCMWRHATQKNLSHALIEIRNDLIETWDQQQNWARRLAPHIRDVFL